MPRMPRSAAFALATLVASLGLLAAVPAAAPTTVAPASVTTDTAPAAASGTVPAAASGIVAARVDDFSFDSLDVDYTIGRADDGTSTLRVVETFVAVFPDSDQNHGMRRAIPDTYNGQPNFPELVSITDENGAPRPSETDSGSGEYQMTSRSDGFLHGRQTFVFTYDLHNVTWDFDNTDATEFYWNVNGLDWPQTFGRVTARLHVPADLASQLTGASACYVGEQGSRATCPILSTRIGADTVVEASAAELGPHQTVTMAVAFTRGTFALFDSSYFASPFGWVQGVAGIGMLGALVAAILVRVRRLSDEPGRPTIIAEYTPPPGVDALESAVLLGKSAKAIPAEVLEQAVVGSIRIVETTTGRRGKATLSAELLDPSRADADGRMLLDGLFPQLTPGETYEFGRTDSRFSSAAQKILKAAAAELVARGLRRSVGAPPRAWPIVAVLVATAAVFVFGMLAIAAGVSPVVPIVLIGLSVPTLFVVAALVSRRPLTAKGAETRDHLLGLKTFIEWAEADRIRMLQSPAGAERTPIDTTDRRQVLRLYESLLPYAVVFGQEKEWSQHLVALYGDQSPYWYSGTSAFSAASFASSIGSLSASTSSATSGGSGGGGSAGGGGGGGGGGGV
ncbi:DUF2207 domain-containing protein [Microbacterium sp. CJ88]|uniref:DUF2207 domain-containing protein n=1 Tax=Microbacterium sp. CJ88 TaxID=3445672 RepID=UPI003F660646